MKKENKRNRRGLVGKEQAVCDELGEGMGIR